MQTEIAAGGETAGYPDLPSSQLNQGINMIAEEDVLRAQVYGLLSRVLATPMSDETLEIIRGLSDIDDSSEMGAAMKAIGDVARRTPRGQAEEEYSALFYGMGSGGEVQPYASYYLTGSVYEKPLAELRRDLTEIGVKATGLNDEPEDHIAFICEIMHGLITGAYGEPAGIERQQAFFSQHVAPWAMKYFEDMEGTKSAVLYMPIGTLGKLFMAVEAEAFGMVAA